MIGEIVLNNKKYITKACATRLLGYSNSNSIGDLVRRRKMSAFKIPGLRKSLVAMDEVRSNPRFMNKNLPQCSSK